MAQLDAALSAIDRNIDASLGRLFELLGIPSISTDPDYKDEVLRAGDFLVGKLREAGLQAERIDVAGHHPLVYAEWLGAPGKPTVLFYGHYDVQPVDPIELWRNPPFEPTVEGDKLVARGATDDKGQSYAHVKAVAAMLAERLVVPQASLASRVEVDGSVLRVTRVTSAAQEEVEATLPAVVSVLEKINEPRYPSFKGIMAAKSNPTTTLSLADLGVDPSSVGLAAAATKVLDSTARPPRGERAIIKDDGDAGARIADFLVGRKLL